MFITIFYNTKITPFILFIWNQGYAFITTYVYLGHNCVYGVLSGRKVNLFGFKVYGNTWKKLRAYLDITSGVERDGTP